jgi:hypothetical protein
MGSPYVDPGPLVKFWWKGVDLVFEVLKSSLSALLVALAVYFTWERKKKREIELINLGEIEKQKELAAEAARVAQKNRLQLLRSELAFLIDEADRLTIGDERSDARDLNQLREQYLSWLSTNELKKVGTNGARAFEWQRKSFPLTPTFETENEATARLKNLEKLLLEFRTMLKQTELPV